MGEVYEAADLVLRQAVALKTIRPDIAGQEMLRARLVEEVRAAKQVVHPGICRIYDLHSYGSDEFLFLTMELLRGETLAGLLSRTGALHLSTAAAVAQQLASVLMAAHEAGVIHRDLKPDNIVLEPESGGIRVVIMDFGLARTAERAARPRRLTRTGEILGTPAYMAPEQLLGKPATAASDIYALGVVLFEMVTGKQPFDGERRLAAAAKRVTMPGPSPRTIMPNLPGAWEQAICRCLEREPAKRFATAAEVWTTISG
jgi:serine/threonine-protein kinase